MRGERVEVAIISRGLTINGKSASCLVLMGEKKSNEWVGNGRASDLCRVDLGE